MKTLTIDEIDQTPESELAAELYLIEQGTTEDVYGHKRLPDARLLRTFPAGYWRVSSIGTMYDSLADALVSLIRSRA